ncbi:hypothetical protein N7481_006999 [Penicillium waksmanii]|uniref:uncharacterized protein n=1 Tax=Penicillium waksmanii TaxID=69791 RepID=UPI002546B1A9|nr:uncharacterized protein N7481_006999 [Penicillium waksmanii]KAJ5979701.1 hypothetical protein N7481_006999 [Penicillium waksmanii]
MKILYIGVFRNGLNPDRKAGDPKRDTVQLCGEKDLSPINYLKRSGAETVMMIDVHGVAEGTQPGQRHDMDHLGYIFHGYSRVKGISGVIVTDGEYPSLVAHQLLSKIMDEFLTKYPRAAVDPSPTENAYPLSVPLKQWIEKYDNPENADSIIKIQQELDSTKIVLHKTIESVLQRGETLDQLMAKSADLSSSSQKFYKQSREQNNCCIVM